MPIAAAHRPAIAAHRLVGDGSTALLLRPDAEIDWWCAPVFDSAPLCWSLLDADGGTARFRHARYATCSGRPAGRTARTTVQTPGGRVEVWDGLLPDASGDAVVLARLVRGLDGDLDVVHELRLGGFGADRPRWSTGTVPHLDVDGHAVHVEGGRSTPDDDATTLLTRLTGECDRWVGLTVSVGAVPDGRPPPADGAALADRLAALDSEQERVLGRARLPRSHPERALDALAVLHACTYAPTGAVVASPTTSLPEVPGADRQFDYRYSWLRDASLAVSVAALLGQGDDARRYLQFVRQIHREQGLAVPVVDVRGGDVPPERSVDGVGGWAGSQPVRVGNGASDQLQYDALGLIVEAISVNVQTGGTLDADSWRMVRDLADETTRDARAVRDSNGIWELRTAGPLVDADIGRWLVLDRVVWIARMRHPLAPRRRWKRARDVIAARVLFALTPSGLLPQAYGQDPPRPDASALMAVIFGLLPASDPRAHRLVDATLEALGAEPFTYRYPPGGPDGFDGVEGAFLPVSFWAVTALAALGRVEEARARLDALCAALPRLLAEEVDPHSGQALGNVPLVWSHMELARSLYVLDAAELRARHGRLALWGWRALRYLRLAHHERRST